MDAHTAAGLMYHQSLRAYLVSCIHLNQAGGMQGTSVWLPGGSPQPSPARATPPPLARLHGNAKTGRSSQA